MAVGLVLLLVAVWVFLRTVAGRPRLANVVLNPTDKTKWTS